MPGKNQYQPVTEANIDPAAFIRQTFNEAIETMKKCEIELTESQQQLKAALEEYQRNLEMHKESEEKAYVSSMQARLPKTFKTNKEYRRDSLVEALEKLRDKVVEDVNRKPSYAGKAEIIANSAKTLTEALTNPDFDIDQKLKAIKEFQLAACPISKTRIALTALIGAVIVAASIFLLMLCPYLIFGGLIGAKFFLAAFAASPAAITSLAVGSSVAGSTLGWSFLENKNQEAFNVIKKAINFAPRPGSSVMGLFFQKSSSNQRQEASTAALEHDHPAATYSI